METICTKSAPAAIGPYSQAQKTDHFVFCSGQLGIDPETKKLAGNTIEAQTTQTLKNIREILKAGGLSLSDVVKTTVFLKNLDDFSAMNGLYEKTFGSHKPARSTVQVARLPLDGLVEIECIAVRS
ncbi:MAG: RidA family protein [Chitinivibrionales bacterium]|nr:RidA family protein [Chitinivibrionales bacterium]